MYPGEDCRLPPSKRQGAAVLEVVMRAESKLLGPREVCNESETHNSCTRLCGVGLSVQMQLFVRLP